MPEKLSMRAVIEADLPIFFEHQLDPVANQMAAFTAKDHADRQAFMKKWHKIIADESVIIRTILCAGRVVGSVLSYQDEGKPEVSYWLDRQDWGKGIATWALSDFLRSHNLTRPIYARVAKDNLASRRVLEKCGFSLLAESIGYANARGIEIPELLLDRSAP